jgi:hypothetical protein
MTSQCRGYFDRIYLAYACGVPDVNVFLPGDEI